MRRHFRRWGDSVCRFFVAPCHSSRYRPFAAVHQATRRVLGVLLRQLDGFDSSKCSIVIAATNRKQDLDPALLSRFDTAVLFNLPDPAAREKILQRYAKHLPQADLATLAGCTSGMSGRDLRDICEQTERRWASQV